MAPSAQLEFENPYQSTATLAEAAAISSATDELIELRAFVGPNFEYFLRKWHPRLEDPQNGDVGVSWIAFFFPIQWMGYRKMYGPLLVYLIASFTALVGLRILFVHGLGQPDAPLFALAILWLLTQVVCLLYGNAWYLQHATNEIDRLKNQGYKGNELLIQLARRGSTSILGIILAMVLSGVATVISNLATLSLGMSI